MLSSDEIISTEEMMMKVMLLMMANIVVIKVFATNIKYCFVVTSLRTLVSKPFRRTCGEIKCETCIRLENILTRRNIVLITAS